MPATRITVALNSNRSQKAPLLVPGDTDADTEALKSLIIKFAQTKLRLKKASRIFVSGTGQELVDDKDWKDILHNDVVVQVSAGEPYIGLEKKHTPSSTGQDHDSDMTSSPACTITNLAQITPIDPISLTQLETTARTIPGIIHAVGQPDLHPGTKFPIGAVFVSKDWIHPPLIGSDIGCGMAWYKTTLSRQQVEGDKGRRVAERLRGLEGPWRTQADREVWLSDSDDSSSPTAVEIVSAGEQWDKSLGTIGAGNHFAELQVVEAYSPSLSSSSSTPLLTPSTVLLLIHSGSRGYGGDILKRHSTLPGTTSLHASTPAATAYLTEHDRACAWARRNRDLIALRFLACIEPGEDVWAIGTANDGSSSSSPLDPTTIRTASASLRARQVVDIWHNAVTKTAWPPSPVPLPSQPQSPPPPPTHHETFIHRKGAAPTLIPSPSPTGSQTDSSPTPYPIIPLPGSRATPTLILTPLFPTSTQYGAHNALSLAHGAGRAMSRAKAATWVAGKYHGRTEALLSGGGGTRGTTRGAVEGMDMDVDMEMERGRGVHGGSWVVCEDKGLVWEEAGEAYKDVWSVMDDLVREGCAEGVGWCWGRVGYKVRKE